MKKVLVSIAIVFGLVSAPAFAWGPREQGILAGAAGLWVYQQLSRPPVVVQQAPVMVSPPPVYQQPPVVYQQPPVVYHQHAPAQVYVYPTNVPIPAGMVCSLYSENINGQIVTNNYCSYR